MDIADAVALAKRYTTPREDKYAVVRFTPGVVSAQTESSGVVIACPDVTFEAAVDAAQLLPMVKKAGKGLAVRLDRNTLVIVGTGGEYRLQGVEAKARDKLPTSPDSPRRFVELDAGSLRLIVEVAALARVGEDSALGAVRITPSWVATSRGNGLALAWFVDAAGQPMEIVKEPATVDAKFFAGLKGAAGLSMTKAFLWVRMGDVSRWTRRVETAWPDAAVSGESLTRLRSGGDNRASTPIDPRALVGLFDRALAAADSRADAYRLTWDANLSLSGGGLRGRFQGAVPIPVDGGGRAFGVAPATWLAYLEALGACCEGEVYMSLAGPTDPAALWGLQPRALEVFIWPEYIPPS